MYLFTSAKSMKILTLSSSSIFPLFKAVCSPIFLFLPPLHLLKKPFSKVFFVKPTSKGLRKTPQII
ncbi:hypothetical protein A6E32_03875 [Chlamydia trachomatis]|nr:hypothetical protein E150_03765 [Chlamydia trachomatis E/150]ADH18426.1 hypothetical protein G9768_03745 [Chlamydia trachomatis G/9768]ADH19351.1 hypothetical protein G11222_03765 [Chlamydia trachomatis G/11222]ADH20273.1 hypothetical protein G11074_03740 [Chlamydia trachomatis G/11074]ADH21194.1 hypothetical protein E11023_03730 [Chlamydia trachomatis E/11023]ADH97371.1 hypothetical protein CTG9301_03755 [Chlamydia trachomatis G/9301]AGR94150.1 hypothetical protein CTRC69_03770 [Chlamydia